MAMHVHHCKCAYNVGGLCYSKNANACHMEKVARGHDTTEIIPNPAPGMENYSIHPPYTEEDCPGYAAPGTPVDLSVQQGDYKIKPYKD